MKKWKEIYEFPDGNCAVGDGEGHLMLKQPPKIISVIPARLEAEVCEWLFDKEYQYPRLALILDEEIKQEIFKYLLDKEYRKEAKIVL